MFLFYIHIQYGYTALIYAAANGHAPCEKLLLEAGADTDAQKDVRIRIRVHCIFLLRFESYTCTC
jgi:ankyrin repeat protein